MRRRPLTFTHRPGQTIDLPLVIPSFTSKGFGFFCEGKGAQKRVLSEATNYLETLGTYIHESMLLSAFDLHHGHFRSPEKSFGNTALILLDSGGYELSPDFDSSEPKITETRRDLEFSASDYEGVLDRLTVKHSNTPLVIANYDWDSRNRPFEEQVKSARKLFNRYKQWSNNFILKPNGKKDTLKGRAIDVNQLLPHIDDFKGEFDIIGITEKELGTNLKDRLKLLATLRVEMDRRDVDAPIHVWGGLDPVITPLYFFAGADIFDGVSWLRYVFHSGLAVNREASSVLSGDLTTPYIHAVALAQNHNLTALQGLANSLRAFAVSESPSFEMFDHNGKVFEKAFRTMTTNIPILKELY